MLQKKPSPFASSIPNSNRTTVMVVRQTITAPQSCETSSPTFTTLPCKAKKSRRNSTPPISSNEHHKRKSGPGYTRKGLPASFLHSKENSFGCGNIALVAPVTTGTCNLQARRGLDLRAWVVGGVVCGKRRN